MSMKALSKAKRNSVTIYEVARRAGVSIATVSRALRDSDLVTPETRRRVLAAADELNFKPSRLGRSLAEGRHAANGIVFPDLIGPYYAEVLLGYEEAAAELGRSVLILATNGRADPSAQVLELATRVDGMVVMGRTVPDQIVRDIAATGTAARAAGPRAGRRPRHDPGRERRHRRRAGRASRRARLPRVRLPRRPRRLARRGRALRRLCPGSCSSSCTGTSRHCVRVQRRRRLRGGPQGAAQKKLPQAIVCANDEVALGTQLAAEERGLAIPENLAVTGWDDVMAARFVGLTTVRQPMRELGGSAASWLHDRMADASRTGQGRRQVLPTQLVIRRSCGTHPTSNPEVPSEG